MVTSPHASRFPLKLFLKCCLILAGGETCHNTFSPLAERAGLTSVVQWTRCDPDNLTHINLIHVTQEEVIQFVFYFQMKFSECISVQRVLC